MSEDFDKEAERKRLREKYEADREDREATERMSELLLQGATMTNQHCDTCGTPIFRYQGRTFCPTCQEERGQAQAQEAAPEAGGEAEEGQPSADAGKVAHEGGPEPDAEAEASAGQPGAEPGRGPQVGHPGGAASPGSPAPDQRSAGARTGGAGQSAPAGSLDEARQSLVQTITSLTRRAAATEDPRQAKELLAAAREAAETLATLQGSR